MNYSQFFIPQNIDTHFLENKEKKVFMVTIQITIDYREKTFGL